MKKKTEQEDFFCKGSLKCRIYSVWGHPAQGGLRGVGKCFEVSFCIVLFEKSGG